MRSKLPKTQCKECGKEITPIFKDEPYCNTHCKSVFIERGEYIELDNVE